MNLFCNVFRFFFATGSDSSQTTITTPTTVTVFSTITSTLPASTTTITTSISSSLTTVTSTVPPSTTTEIVSTTSVSQTTILSTVTVTTTGTPTTIVSGSGTASTVCVSNCAVDVFATALVFTQPVSVVSVTVPTAALDVHITVFSNGTTATSTSTRQLAVLPEQTAASAVTWEFSGVPLTWPTTYLAYTGFFHDFIPFQTVTSVCTTTSESLALPTPTDWASLIFPADQTPGPNLPPIALINYLNAQPVVLAQLSGTPIGQSCDPVAGGVASPTTVTGGAQVVYTSVHVLAQTPGTTDTTSVQVESAIAQQATAVAVTTVGGGTTTSTSTSTAPRSTAATVATAASSGLSTVASTSSVNKGNGTSSIPQQVSTAGGERAAEVNFVGMEGWLAGVLGVGAGLGML